MAGEKSRFGKRVGGAVYFHRSSIDALDEKSRTRLEAANMLVHGQNWNVAKLSDTDHQIVSLLEYQDFESEAFPSLLMSHSVNLQSGKATSRSYQTNPPILHRKELLLAPGDERISKFKTLTYALEQAGVFVDMAKRGRRDAWNAVLEEAGLIVRDHELLSIKDLENNSGADVAHNQPTNDYAGSAIQRHRTAIVRNNLSAPMAALNLAGFFTDGVSVLDYGCGRGDDIQALVAAGVDAVGWDPYFAPDRAVLMKRDLVNLGFVLNVIEDVQERREVLRSAFELAGKCLVVAVMLVGRGDVSGLRPHRDGFVTTRGTFQKYYTQTELRDFIAEALNITPVAAGPGIFFVFADEEAEQRYLSQRQTKFGVFSSFLTAPRPLRADTGGLSGRQKVLDDVRDDLANTLLFLGRAPDVSEISPQTLKALERGRISLKAGINDALTSVSEGKMRQSIERRTEDISRFFALSAFSGRQAYRRLDPSLQRDIRAFFGTVKAAESAGRRTLFEAGDNEGLFEDVRSHVENGLGQLVGDKFQLHARDFNKLSSRLKTYIGIGETLVGSIDDTTIFRVHLTSKKLTALRYSDFDTSAMPRLSERTKIDFRSGEVIVFDHMADGRVSLLLNKSAYMTGSESVFEAQVSFENELRNLVGGDLVGVPFREVAAAMIKGGISAPY